MANKLYDVARPNWPYTSADGEQKDKEVFLPTPVVQDGVWYLSSDDIQCLSIGCGILGSGGGGDQKYKQIAIDGWVRGKKLKIYNPMRFSQEEWSTSMFCVVGFDGNPRAVHSVDQIGVESTAYALKLVQQALASGLCDPHNGDCTHSSTKVRVTKETMADGSVVCLANVDDLRKVDIGPDAKIPKDHRIAGLFALEIGEVNTMGPIRCAAEMVGDEDDSEVILIDAAGEERAVPKLSMWLPFLNGIRPYPSALSDGDGNKLVCCTNISNADELETFFRTKVVEMGSNAGISFGVMSLMDIMKMCIPFAISHAWEIGRRVIRATRQDNDPVKAILQEEEGSKIIISGKIVEVYHLKKGKPGYNSTKITISGNDVYAGYIVIARALNEMYAVLSRNSDEMYACAPDTISMVDPQTGIPVTAGSDHLEGRVVSLICILSNPNLKSPPSVLDAVGPKAYQDLVKDGFTSYKHPHSVNE